MNYLRDNYAVEEEKLYIGDIPTLRLKPKGKEGRLPSIIFYHGLDSNKERQRLRGYILSFLGYQVFIPDAIHHGERDRKESQDPKLIARYFWQAILQSVKESSFLTQEIIGKYNGDRDKIYATGHSMGGFISAGVLANNKDVKKAMPMNGSFDWEKSSSIMLESMGLASDFTIPEEEDMVKYSPINNIGKLEGKEILILHGEVDPEVDIRPQKDFFEANRSRLSIEMIVYEGLGHTVSTNMLDDLIKWLKDIKE